MLCDWLASRMRTCKKPVGIREKGLGLHVNTLFFIYVFFFVNFPPSYFSSFCLYFALTFTPGSPLFSLTIQLRYPFPCHATFVTGPKSVEAELPGIYSINRLLTWLSIRSWLLNIFRKLFLHFQTVSTHVKTPHNFRTLRLGWWLSNTLSNLCSLIVNLLVFLNWCLIIVHPMFFSLIGTNWQWMDLIYSLVGWLQCILRWDSSFLAFKV